MPKQHVFGITAKRFKGRAFGEQTSYLRGLVRIASRIGMRAYVFSLRDVDLEEHRVNAWVWTSQGWRRRLQPMPTVIYDRMWGMNEQTRENHERELTLLNTQKRIPFFNPPFGDKHDVHLRLITHRSLQPHLPQTAIATTEALTNLAQRHTSIYVKPVRGRQGKGIARIDIDRNKYQVTSQQGSNPVWTTDSPEQVLSRFLQDGTPQDFIVQQGLNLLRVRGGTVDVRVIIQRDGKGEWQVSAIGCRIGPRGGFVSNLHAGGRAASLSVLGPYLPRSLNLRTLRRDIEDLAMKTAYAMTESHPLLGEIGLDLGVDRTGQLWILELNRQPGRALFSRAGLRKAWRRSRVRVVQFAKYLSQTHTQL